MVVRVASDGRAFGGLEGETAKAQVQGAETTSAALRNSRKLPTTRTKEFEGLVFGRGRWCALQEEHWLPWPEPHLPFLHPPRPLPGRWAERG